jgi:hypothetical protein
MSKGGTYRDHNKNLGDYDEDGLELHGGRREETNEFEITMFIWCVNISNCYLSQSVPRRRSQSVI